MSTDPKFFVETELCHSDSQWCQCCSLPIVHFPLFCQSNKSLLTASVSLHLCNKCTDNISSLWHSSPSSCCPFLTLMNMRHLVGIKATVTSTRRSRIMVPFLLFLLLDRKSHLKLWSWRGSSNRVWPWPGVCSPLSPSSPLLSQDIKGDLLQLICKGPGWASATEQNNYSQLLPICPTVSNSTWAADANTCIQTGTNTSTNTPADIQYSPHKPVNRFVLLTVGHSMSSFHFSCLLYFFCI